MTAFPVFLIPLLQLSVIAQRMLLFCRIQNDSAPFGVLDPWWEVL